MDQLPMADEEFEPRPTIILPDQLRMRPPEAGGIARLLLKDGREVTVALDMKGMVYGVEVAESTPSHRNPIDFGAGDILDLQVLNQPSAAKGKKFV
jgi:adenine specific DNA methylase Mod